MIPILYSNKERDFVTNGFGSLSDATTCVVTEERNGQFELEMTYPVTGRHYPYIVLDNIIFAKPSEDKDPQPFQIYDISTPIDGIITVKAHHISYRLSYIPITPFSASGAIGVCESIKNHEIISSPFILSTDITNTSSKITLTKPISFRECLGGVEGSFLDIFGGEIEWDKFEVKIKASRGQDNNVRITYSKNLQDFTNDESNDDKTTAILPYWCDSDTGEIIVCGIVDAVKSETYSELEDRSVSWESDKYYELKQNDKYYRNNFLVPQIFSENTYYKFKDRGIYKIPESDQAPEFGVIYEHITSSEQTPQFVEDQYYYYDSINNEYYLLTSEPEDWSTNYINYFVKVNKYFSENTHGYFHVNEASPRYIPLNTDNMPEYVKGKYYTYDNETPIEVNNDSAPNDWLTSINKYYYKDISPIFQNDTYYSLDDASYSYIPRSCPQWVSYKYYKFVDNRYELLYSEPEDWGSNYTSYFVEKPNTDPIEYENIQEIPIPEYTPGKYYKVVDSELVIVNDQQKPEDWDAKYYIDYYIMNDDTYSLLTSKPNDWSDEFITPVKNNFSEVPQYVANTYYQKETGGRYSLLTSENAPEDWSTNYNNYYHGETDYGFKKYYTYIPLDYDPLLSEPEDWSTNYTNYYELYIPEKDENSPIYILLTEEPEDWYEILDDDLVYGCNKYYTKYTNNNGILEYSLLFSQPSDWGEVSGNTYYICNRELYDSSSDFKRIIPYDFSSEIQSKPSEKLLENVAKEYMRKTTMVDDKLNLDVSFVSLWQTEEYKNVAHLERVNLCDIVTIDFPPNMNLESRKLKVIQTTFDVLADKYTKIKLGNSTSSLSTTIAGIGETIKEEISTATSTLAESIARMVDAMMGGRGGFMHVEYNGENQPCELIFGDTADPETMKNCLRINYKGIAFSKDGMYGTYNSVWDLNGEFDGQCIRAGSIDGYSIKAGSLTANKFTTSAKKELLETVDQRLDVVEKTGDIIKRLDGVVAIDENGIRIGNGKVYLQQEIVTINDHETAIISFMELKDDGTFNRVAYVSGDKFYTTNMQIGGYLISGSLDNTKGISFNWIGGSEPVNG